MIDGLEFAARYSLVPNSFGYCGGNNFAKIFSGYLKRKVSKKELIFELKKFKSLYAYLKTIARANKKKPFDRDVLEAFWIGNSLLKKVTQKDIKNLILDELCKNAGMDRKRAISSAKNLPKNILIHHSFNSLYLNFVGNSVPRTLSNFDNCRVGWGKVIAVNKKYCILDYALIKRVEKRYCLAKPIKRRFNRYVCGILLEPNINIGDLVSTHWGAVVQKINKKQLFSLKKFTYINFCHINTF